MCVIYRTDTVRLTQFLPKIEKIVFPKITSLRYETFIVGVFNSNTSITVNNKVKYESLFNSYDCKIQNTLPHRNYTENKFFFDHWIEGNKLYTQPIEITTISYQFTIAASVHLTSRKSYKNQQREKKGQKKTNLKEDKGLRFLFLLDQMPKTIPSTLCTEMRVQMMCENIDECIDMFELEKEVVIKKETNMWITNEFENSMVKRDCFFRKYVEKPNSKKYQV